MIIDDGGKKKPTITAPFPLVYLAEKQKQQGYRTPDAVLRLLRRREAAPAPAVMPELARSALGPQLPPPMGVQATPVPPTVRALLAGSGLPAPAAFTPTPTVQAAPLPELQRLATQEPPFLPSDPLGLRKLGQPQPIPSLLSLQERAFERPWEVVEPAPPGLGVPFAPTAPGIPPGFQPSEHVPPLTREALGLPPPLPGALRPSPEQQREALLSLAKAAEEKGIPPELAGPFFRGIAREIQARYPELYKPEEFFPGPSLEALVQLAPREIGPLIPEVKRVLNLPPETPLTTGEENFLQTAGENIISRWMKVIEPLYGDKYSPEQKRQAAIAVADRAWEFSLSPEVPIHAMLAVSLASDAFEKPKLGMDDDEYDGFITTEAAKRFALRNFRDELPEDEAVQYEREVDITDAVLRSGSEGRKALEEIEKAVKVMEIQQELTPDFNKGPLDIVTSISGLAAKSLYHVTRIAPGIPFTDIGTETPLIDLLIPKAPPISELLFTPEEREAFSRPVGFVGQEGVSQKFPHLFRAIDAIYGAAFLPTSAAGAKATDLGITIANVALPGIEIGGEARETLKTVGALGGGLAGGIAIGAALGGTPWLARLWRIGLFAGNPVFYSDTVESIRENPDPKVLVHTLPPLLLTVLGDYYDVKAFIRNVRQGFAQRAGMKKTPPLRLKNKEIQDLSQPEQIALLQVARARAQRELAKGIAESEESPHIQSVETELIAKPMRTLIGDIVAYVKSRHDELARKEKRTTDEAYELKTLGAFLNQYDGAVNAVTELTRNVIAPTEFFASRPKEGESVGKYVERIWPSFYGPDEPNTLMGIALDQSQPILRRLVALDRIAALYREMPIPGTATLTIDKVRSDWSPGQSALDLAVAATSGRNGLPPTPLGVLYALVPELFTPALDRNPPPERQARNIIDELETEFGLDLSPFREWTPPAADLSPENLRGIDTAAEKAVEPSPSEIDLSRVVPEEGTPYVPDQVFVQPTVEQPAVERPAVERAPTTKLDATRTREVVQSIVDDIAKKLGLSSVEVELKPGKQDYTYTETRSTLLASLRKLLQENQVPGDYAKAGMAKMSAVLTDLYRKEKPRRKAIDLTTVLSERVAKARPLTEKIAELGAPTMATAEMLFGAGPREPKTEGRRAHPLVERIAGFVQKLASEEGALRLGGPERTKAPGYDRLLLEQQLRNLKRAFDKGRGKEKKRYVVGRGNTETQSLVSLLRDAEKLASKGMEEAVPLAKTAASQTLLHLMRNASNADVLDDAAKALDKLPPSQRSRVVSRIRNEIEGLLRYAVSAEAVKEGAHPSELPSVLKSVQDWLRTIPTQPKPREQKPSAARLRKPTIFGFSRYMQESPERLEEMILQRLRVAIDDERSGLGPGARAKLRDTLDRLEQARVSGAETIDLIGDVDARGNPLEDQLNRLSVYTRQVVLSTIIRSLGADPETREFWRSAPEIVNMLEALRRMRRRKAAGRGGELFRDAIKAAILDPETDQLFFTHVENTYPLEERADATLDTISTIYDHLRLLARYVPDKPTRADMLALLRTFRKQLAAATEQVQRIADPQERYLQAQAIARQFAAMLADTYAERLADDPSAFQRRRSQVMATYASLWDEHGKAGTRKVEEIIDEFLKSDAPDEYARSNFQPSPGRWKFRNTVDDFVQWFLDIALSPLEAERKQPLLDNAISVLAYKVFRSNLDRLLFGNARTIMSTIADTVKHLRETRGDKAARDFLRNIIVLSASPKAGAFRAQIRKLETQKKLTSAELLRTMQERTDIVSSFRDALSRLRSAFYYFDQDPKIGFDPRLRSLLHIVSDIHDAGRFLLTPDQIRDMGLVPLETLKSVTRQVKRSIKDQVRERRQRQALNAPEGVVREFFENIADTWKEFFRGKIDLDDTDKATGLFLAASLSDRPATELFFRLLIQGDDVFVGPKTLKEIMFEVLEEKGLPHLKSVLEGSEKLATDSMAGVLARATNADTILRHGIEDLLSTSTAAELFRKMPFHPAWDSRIPVKIQRQRITATPGRPISERRISKDLDVHYPIPLLFHRLRNRWIVDLANKDLNAQFDDVPVPFSDPRGFLTFLDKGNYNRMHLFHSPYFYMNLADLALNTISKPITASALAGLIDQMLKAIASERKDVRVYQRLRGRLVKIFDEAGIAPDDEIRPLHLYKKPEEAGIDPDDMNAIMDTLRQDVALYDAFRDFAEFNKERLQRGALEDTPPISFTTDYWSESRGALVKRVDALFEHLESLDKAREEGKLPGGSCT